MGEAFVKSIFTTFFSCGLKADIMVTTFEGVESCITGISIGTFLTKSCSATFSSLTILIFLLGIFCFFDFIVFELRIAFLLLLFVLELLFLLVVL